MDVTDHATRKLVLGLAAMVLLAGLAALGIRFRDDPPLEQQDRGQARRNLFAEFQPVKIANCEFERVGDAHDGGYLICRNLANRAEAVYSYGISGSDEWGCTLSARLKVPVHQYDCFNRDRPPCSGATPVFHEECVGPARVTEAGRPFDTVHGQIAKNGDHGKRLIMKMDVEGAEWPSFLVTPEAVLNQIDQLIVEFHGVEDARFLETIRKLKGVFHVAHIHHNNWACHPDVAPFPSLAFEVLFVNKNLAVVEPGRPAVMPHALDSPNNKDRPDCQSVP